MTPEEAAVALAQNAAILSAEANGTQIEAVISHGTKLRGLPDEYAGYPVYYTHDNGETDT